VDTLTAKLGFMMCRLTLGKRVSGRISGETAEEMKKQSSGTASSGD